MRVDFLSFLNGNGESLPVSRFPIFSGHSEVTKTKKQVQNMKNMRKCTRSRCLFVKSVAAYNTVREISRTAREEEEAN